MPSSTNTSSTLPVTFEETVARRRAVTYPDAFNTAPGATPALLRAETAAVFTSAASTRCDQYHPAPASASTTRASTAQTPRRPPPARELCSIRSEARSSLRLVTEWLVFTSTGSSIRQAHFRRASRWILGERSV